MEDQNGDLVVLEEDRVGQLLLQWLEVEVEDEVKNLTC